VSRRLPRNSRQWRPAGTRPMARTPDRCDQQGLAGSTLHGPWRSPAFRAAIAAQRPGSLKQVILPTFPGHPQGPSVCRFAAERRASGLERLFFSEQRSTPWEGGGPQRMPAVGWRGTKGKPSGAAESLFEGAYHGGHLGAIGPAARRSLVSPPRSRPPALAPFARAPWATAKLGGTTKAGGRPRKPRPLADWKSCWRLPPAAV